MPLPLVVISGWAMPPGAIEDCLPEDRTIHWLTPEQLAGACSQGIAEGIDDWLGQLPDHAVWVGWSLGGQLAMSASELFPGRIATVITLCSSPCFVAGPDWTHGVSPALFDEFRQRLARSPQATLEHFCSLMLYGASGAKAQRRALRARDWPMLPEPGCLERTLGWLGGLDQRELWRHPVVPARHLFGEMDSLVSVTTARALGLPSHRWQAIAGMAHWPGGRFAGEALCRINAWLDQVVS